MIVAIIARRLNLPYTVGLVLAGQGLAVAGLAVAGRETGAMLTHDFIFEVILPPLLFEAALKYPLARTSSGYAEIALSHCRPSSAQLQGIQIGAGCNGCGARMASSP